MDTAIHFFIGTVVGFWGSVFLFGTLIYRAGKSLPKPVEVRTNVRDLYPPKDNN